MNTKTAGAVRIGAWILVPVSLSVQLLAVWKDGRFGDFLPVWTALRAMLHQLPPYAPDNAVFVYPPSSLLLLGPLGLPSFEVGALFMTGLTVVAVLTAGLLMLRLLDIPVGSLSAALLLAALTVFVPVTSTLHLGNVNGLVFVGEAAFLLLAARDRWLLAAIALGLTIAIKPVLVPLILLPILRRRWSSAAIVVAVPTVLSAIALLVIVRGGRFFSQVVPFLFGGNAASLQYLNVSLGGALTNLGIGGSWVLAPRMGVVVLVCYLLVRLLRRGAGDQRLLLLESSALILVGTFLAFSFSWNYYGLFLVPALVSSLIPGAHLPRAFALAAAYLLGGPDILLWRYWSDSTQLVANIRPALGFMTLLIGFTVGLLLVPVPRTAKGRSEQSSTRPTSDN